TMNVPTVACTNCGKPFTTDDLRGTSCKYCGTLLAHHARAQQQIAVVNGMLADRNGNGIPDAYEGLVANAQANAMQQAFGAPYAAPPTFGAPPPHFPPGYNPYAQAAQVQIVTNRAVSRALITVVVAVGAVIFAMVAIGVAVALLTVR